MKTIICPEYLHTSLTLKLMQQHNTNQLNDYKLLSLHSFLMSKFDNDETNNLILINKIRSTEVSFFKEMLKYPSFINEIIDFTKLIKAFNISLTSLPQNDYKQKELYDLVNSIYNETFFENNYHYLNDLTNLNDLYLYPTFNNCLDDLIYQVLKSNGAHILSFNIDKPKITLYKALNARNEIESIAQDIIKNNYNLQDINLICSNKNYYDIIITVFNRYNIAYYFTNYKLKDKACLKYYYLINLYLNFTIDNLILAIKNNAFNTYINKEYITYISNYIADINDLFKPFDYFNNIKIKSIDQKEINKLINLENEANKCNIIDALTIIKNNNLKQMLIDAYDLIKDETTLNLKHLIEKYYLTINEDNIYDFLTLLKNQTIAYKDKPNGIIITDIFNPILPNKISYIVGLDQKNYPGYKTYNGYFNEEYMALIDIPSNDYRYKLHMQNLEWLFNNASIINLSYPIASFEGKSIDVAYYIESRFNKAINYPIIQNDYLPKEIHSLSIDNAYKSFVKNKYIKGSISSFEKYFNCPYAYFLNYGLKLYDNQLIDIQPNTFGTIAHSIMEKLCKKYNKDYPSISDNELTDIIHPLFDDLRLIFKNKQIEINSMEQRLYKQIQTNLIFLKDMEKNTPFTPTYFEDYFEVVITSLKDTNILINGIIDRIDTYDNMLRIIDYKSSKKTLEQKKILAGLQLQLLTYTYIAALKYNLAPAGSYYYSLNISNISNTTYSYKQTSGMVKNNEDKLNAFIKSHKLNGFTYLDDCNNLDDGKHINALKVTKEGDVLCYGNPYDYEKIRQLIHDLYHYLLDELLKGHIEASPQSGACSYCKYHRICRFYGKEKDIKPLVNYELKKGKKEDEMESITA